MHKTDLLDQEIQEYDQINKLGDEHPVITTETTKIWHKVLTILAKKLKKPSFETWIKPNFLIKIESEFAVISVRNEFTRNFLLQSFASNIQNALKEVTGTCLALQFLINDSYQNPLLNENYLSDDNEPESPQLRIAELKKTNESTTLLTKNSGQSFKNLIPTESNKSAINFTKAIVDNNTGIYKSLIIYSETGLGKTHLLQAAYNSAQEKSLRTKFITGEKFTNELIIAIQRNETFKFRQNYRNLDLLIFDDIAFLDNKKSCQEELCHTLESILSSGGKFISSSSKRLKDFRNLSPKLKSILQSSLISELSKLNISDREAIIRYKASKLKLNLAEDQITKLAEKATEGIRELEGFLLRLSAEINLNHMSINDEAISNIFGGLFNQSPNLGLSLEKISISVAEYFGLELKDILGSKRTSELTKARHLAIYLSYDLLELSYSRIGEHYSNRKHSSIIHSINTVKTLLNSNLPSANANIKIIEDIKLRLSDY
jgi:chromosomal replication initiator protein